uniref:Uncharacterized protein n=1 Tax=Rhizophora mucronata TaxID=61149 RepID=A0A2P2QDL1_RHIMU
MEDLSPRYERTVSQ